MGPLPKLLGLLLILQIGDVQGEICPPLFRLRGNECFFIHDDVSETLDWDESRRRCLDMGGDLAQPQDMVDFVKYIEKDYPNIKSYGNLVWLGATDREVERQWKWLSGEAVSSALWLIGEALQSYTEPSGDGNCMNLFYINGYFTNDAPCTYTAYRSHFACEIDIISFEDFEKQYGLKFEGAEKTMRIKIFKDNLKEIQTHNKLYDAKLTSYRKGVNRYTHLTYTEFISQHTGFIEPDAAQSLNNKPLEGFYQPINIPNMSKHHNWIAEGAVNPIRDQLTCKSCWAFSVTSVIESQIKLKYGELQQLSEQYLVDCDTPLTHGNHTHGCNGGWPNFAITFVKNHGIAFQSEYPYTGKEAGSCISTDTASKTKYRVASELKIDHGNDFDLLNAIQNIGPISVAIYASDNLKQYKDGVLYNKTDCIDKPPNHAVSVVGYGTTEDGHDYWLIRNSWGTTHGEQGYQKLTRMENNFCSISSHAVFPVLRDCEDVWHRVGSQCFLWVYSGTTWPLAQDACQKMGRGTDLAQPDDIDLFWDYMKTIGAPGGHPRHYWLIGAEVVFKWPNGTPPPGSCVILTWLVDGTTILKAIPCTRGGAYYICGRHI